MSTSSFDELCAKAREAISTGKYADGRDLYRQALEVSGQSADAHYGLATCCFMLNEYSTALQHFLEVTRLDPMRATAFVNLGALYNRLGKIEEAIAHLRKGLQLDPRRAEGYYNLGIAYRQKGQLDLAIQAYREATRYNPRMADAFFNLANALLECERFHEAIASYQQAIALRPNFDKAIQGLATAQHVLSTVVPAVEQHFAPQQPGQLAEPAAPAAAARAHGFSNVIERAEAMDALRDLCSKQEEHCRELVRILEQDLGSAMRELSRCLVGTPARGELELHVQAYESSLETLRAAQSHMEEGMGQIRHLGDRFAAAAQASGDAVA